MCCQQQWQCCEGLDGLILFVLKSVTSYWKTHTGGLADCDGKIIRFALAALQRHSFLFCPFPVLLHLLHAAQWKQQTNQEPWKSCRLSEKRNMFQSCMMTSETLDSTEASLPASTWPYLVPLHERFILPAESLDLLVQLQVPLMIPLGHHVTGGLGRDTSDHSYDKKVQN